MLYCESRGATTRARSLLLTIGWVGLVGLGSVATRTVTFGVNGSRQIGVSHLAAELGVTLGVSDEV